MKILIAILMLGLAFQVKAGEDRGGGGAFCINKKCITVAEAGFRFQPKKTSKTSDIDFSLPISIELDAEVKNIESLLPKSADFNVSHVNINTYVRVSSYNVNKFQVYKKTYFDLFKKSGISPKGFELLAVSDVKERKTYLLPEFYKAGLRTQALILFHESAIRDGFSVREALILDGMILDYLDGKIDAASLVLEKLKYKITAREKFYILANKYADQGHYIELKDLPLDVDMSNVQSISKISQAYPAVWKLILEAGGHYVAEKVKLARYGLDEHNLDLDERCSSVSGNKRIIVGSNGEIVVASCSNGMMSSYTLVLVY